MGSNKVATVVLFDVSRQMNELTDNGETYFKRSLNCLKKMILRKMFAQDNDEMGILLFGSDKTNNSLARNGKYENICIFSHLSLPDWKLIDEILELNISSVNKSDWIEGLVVSLDFMKSESQGKRFREKQLIIFSSFSSVTYLTTDSLKPIIDIMEGDKIKFIVIGIDLEDYKEPNSELPSSLDLIFKTINLLEMAITYSFEEVENELIYFEKKRKMKRLTRINLMIGSEIELPVRWMKVTNEETRLKWQSVVSETHIPSIQNEVVKEAEVIEFVTDIKKTTNFGDTLVDLSYADLEAMKRKTGPPSFLVLGTVKRKRIPRYMFVGKDVYAILPDKNQRSQAMFSALVDGLLKHERYALARRVATKDGKITIGALLPVTDEGTKAMYYLKLPFAEWVQTLPSAKPLSEPDIPKAREAIRDLIRSAILPEDLGEEGKGLLLRDPLFQSRCDAISMRGLGEEETTHTTYSLGVQRILKPFTFSDKANEALSRLEEIFSIEEPSGVTTDKRDETVKVNGSEELF